MYTLFIRLQVTAQRTDICHSGEFTSSSVLRKKQHLFSSCRAPLQPTLSTAQLAHVPVLPSSWVRGGWEHPGATSALSGLALSVLFCSSDDRTWQLRASLKNACVSSPMQYHEWAGKQMRQCSLKHYCYTALNLLLKFLPLVISPAQHREKRRYMKWN